MKLICTNCNKDFDRSFQNKSGNNWCSDKCYRETVTHKGPRSNRPCATCGKFIDRWPSQIRGVGYCDNRCKVMGKRGKDHPSYKANKKPQGGYIMDTVPPELDEMKPRSGRVYTVAQHRIVMAKAIGRPLTSDETVHHKNEIKTDNRLSNLELWPTNSSHILCAHKGGFVEGLTNKL